MALQAALQIRTQRQQASYPVYIQRGLGKAWKAAMAPLLAEKKHFFLISEKGIPKKLIKDFLDNERSHFPLGLRDTSVLWMQGGEKSKNLSRLTSFYKTLIHRGVDRNSCIFALGGGIVGDFAGFLAASILRGIDFVQIPTTLLAAVDASVGGKVAVNVANMGKNMVGAFHQPRFVYINLDFLASLPPKEWCCGLAEMLKHALLEKNGRLLRELFSNASHYSSPALGQAIRDSIAVKAAIVQKDTKEGGMRALLNLGHTTAHALEALGRYKRFSHGEAVSRGLVSALLLSRKLLALDSAYVENCFAQMQKLKLPQDTAAFSARAVYKQMRYDKKSKAGEARFVLLKAPGEGLWNQEIAFQDFEKIWSEQKERFG